MIRLLSILALCALVLRGQDIAAVVNLGDWSDRLTFHSLAAVFGNGLAAEECVATQLPLPNTLCGVSVILIDASGAEALAPLFYVSPGQINFQVPASQWFTGKDPVRSQSSPVGVRVRVDPVGASKDIVIDASQAPVILEYSTASGQAPIILHADGTLVTDQSPATWNEALIAYGIGFGIYSEEGIFELGAGRWPTSFPGDGQAAPLDRLVEISPGLILQVKGQIGGVPTTSLYTIPVFVGLAPGFVGLNQINFELPCILSESPEPQIAIEGFLSGRTKTYRIPMSEAAKAAWGGRDCR